MKYLFLISIVLLLFSSCEIKSSLSKGKVENLNLIGAEFKISSSNDQSIYVSGNLFDKDDNAIDNDSIKIKVNNVDLYLGKIPGMGLNDYEYRSFDKIPISYNYNFEIILTNGKKYFLGSIKPIKKINKNDITSNEIGDLEKESIVTWQNLNDYNELEIYKSYRSLKPDKKNNILTSNDSDTLKIKDNGKFIVPKAMYNKNNIPIDFIVFYFRVEKKGKINSELITGSEIIIKEEIQKQINFKRE